MIEKVNINFLQNNWVLLLTTFFTIIGLPLSIYFYFKSKKEKILKLEVKSNNIFKNFESIIENIKITCDDKNISTLTITNILMWCDGKETIYDKDIATQMPLVIKAKEGKEILKAKIVSSNNSTNNIVLEKLENNSYKINFEYLDNKDGFIIQVIHTGNNSNDIIINGKIKGMKGNIEKKYSENGKILKKVLRNKLLKYFVNKNGYYFPLIISLMVIIFFTYILFFESEELKQEIGVTVVAIYFIFTYTLVFLFLLRIILKKRRIPKEFQEF